MSTTEAVCLLSDTSLPSPSPSHSQYYTSSGTPSLALSHYSPHRLSDRHLTQCAHGCEAEGGLGGREEQLEHCV
jgi:hypothetical protein